MKTHLQTLTLSAMVIMLTAGVASAYDYGYDPTKAAPAGDNYMYMELAQDPTIIVDGVYAGKYEYFFDMYTLANGSGSTFYFLHLVGLDNSKIANAQTNRPVADYGPGGETTVNTQRWGDPNGAYEAWPAATGRVMDLWSKGSNATVGDATNFDRWRSSYDNGAGGWTDSGLGYAEPSMSNPHSYGEYVNFSGHPAMEIWKAELTGPGQPLHWWNTQFGVVPLLDTIYIAGSTVWSTTGTAGLTFTLRVVYDDIIDPATIGWSGDATIDNDILGDFSIPLPPPGSFDGDYDVDDVDIDMLCDFIRNSMPYDLLYDISGAVEGVADGFVDTLDLDYLIRSLVETSLGTGTEYGDFNLDGLIDTTDLTRLATNYGDDDWKWDDGNANRNIDTNIDNTDLTILATYYGTGPGDPDVVPEPMTLSILALGAAGLLRRRRQA